MFAIKRGTASKPTGIGSMPAKITDAIPGNESSL